MAGVLFAADLRDVWDRVRGRPLRPRAFRPNDWTIEEVERAIRFQPVEWAYAFDLSGRQVVCRRGTKRIVAFDAAELPLLRDATLVHNHPVDDEAPAESLTFSDLDLVFAVRYNLAESRVVAEDWRFTMQRPATGCPADEGIVLTVYNETLLAVNDELVAAMAEGRMTQHERETRQYDETIRRVAAWGRITYRRERLEPSL